MCSDEELVAMLSFVSGCVGEGCVGERRRESKHIHVNSLVNHCIVIA